MPQVITANRLTDGIVVYFGQGGQWVEFVTDAATFDGKPSVEAALARALSDVGANQVVDVFAFDVTLSAGGPWPNHIRDQIRAQGPTVHPDHGKQAAMAGARKG